MEFQRSEARQSAVRDFSTFIYERRARAELLASALLRGAPQAEVTERKQLYDQTYVRWNTNHQANLLLIRQVLGEQGYSEFENLVEFRLVIKVFKPLDDCLTSAYDRRLRGGDPNPILRGCRATVLIQQALDCGYALTDELFRISGLAQGAREGSQRASSIVQTKCP